MKSFATTAALPGEALDQPARRHDHAYFQGLRRRLRLQLLVLYVTPLLLLSLFFHAHYTRTLRQGVENHLRATAENQRNTVDLFLQERTANLRNLLADPSPNTGPTAQQMGDLLGRLRRESTTFVDLGLFSDRGELIAYAGPHDQLVGRSYASEAWFRQLQEGVTDHVISDVYLGYRGEPHIVIAVPYLTGGVRWALRASVDPQEFGRFVDDSYLLDNAEAFVVNREGVRQTLAPHTTFSGEPSAVTGRSDETQVGEVEVEGRAYLRALSWLSHHEWALVVRVPADLALAPLRRARLALVAIMMLTLALIAAVVLRGTERIVSRLESADRGRQSLQTQLISAAKLASVGEVAAGVAHEINNPLAIVYEEAAMMEDILDPQFGLGADMDDFRERLKTIKEASIRGRDITRKLLAFARQHDPEPTATCLTALVSKVVDAKQQSFRVSSVELTTVLDADIPPVMINPNQMEQVVHNLLNNAKDALGGPGRVAVRTDCHDGWVRLAVEDDGCGMSPEVLQRVFFPFFTTKGVGRGTGLGLSISYGIVHGFGGRIEVESEEGVGTTFAVLLPATTSDAARAA